MFHHANATTQTAIIHAAAQTPLITFGIIDLDCFQIGSSIEATDGVQLTVNNSETNLKLRKIV